MRAGKLRERITLQDKVVSRDAYGAETITWTTVATVPADAIPLSGREYVAMRAAQADISIRFRIRYLAGVGPAMRAVWRAVAYDIVECINVGARDRQIELLCRGEAGGV